MFASAGIIFYTTEAKHSKIPTKTTISLVKPAKKASEKAPKSLHYNKLQKNYKKHLQIRKSYVMLKSMKSRAAVRTVKILETISTYSEGLTLSEVAAETGIPIASTNDIVKALLDEEMIEILDQRSKAYGVGAKAFAIGNRFIANTSLVDKAKTPMVDLGERTERTVFLGKEVNRKITYLHKYEHPGTIVATCSIGSQKKLHNTSLGKCFLAYQEGLLETLKGVALEKVTPWTITEYSQLKEEINRIKEQGYAVDTREQNENLLCIGAPIFDSHGKIVASISVSGIYKEDIDVSLLGNLVKETGLHISRSLGYRG